MTKNNLRNLNFDDGLEEITINGDESRVVRWSLGDVNLIDRLMNLVDWLENDLPKEIKTANLLEADVDSYKKGSVSKLGDKVNAEVDKVFGANTAKAAFGRANPISMATNGKYIFENFIEAVLPLVQESMDTNESKKDEYVKAAKGNKIK